MFGSPNSLPFPNYSYSSGERSRKRNTVPTAHRVRHWCQRVLLLIVRMCASLKIFLTTVCACFGGANSGRSPSNQRGSLSGRDIVPLDAQVAAGFPDNTVINSRYTIFNFIFKNLYEQFRRPLNFYFLLVALLQFISIIAPVNPLSTLLPLMFAFSLTAVKEGYDDVKRHRQDKAYNTKPRLVLNRLTGDWCPTLNSDIRVGDVILLHQNDEVPCDCLVLAAPTSSVFIRTDNLDGEIDLKPRSVVAPAVEQALATPSHDAQATDPAIESDFTGSNAAETSEVATFFCLDDDGAALLEKLSCLTLRCPPPNGNVDSFDGVAEFARRELSASPVRLAAPESKFPSTRLEDVSSHQRPDDDETVKVSLSHHHLLPQSCLLKNTESAICVAVYTGNETKCGMNKLPPPVKWAKIDKDVSKYSVFIFCCQMLSAVTFGVTGFLCNRHVESRYWYLPAPAKERANSFLIYPLRFFLLTTVMIPVSFKFVVDMSKYYMSLSVEWDEAMVHGELGGCKVNNSSILEDLGQIDYILSDKTGTMTQNVMELHCISVVPDIQINLSDLCFPPSIFASPAVASTATWSAAGARSFLPVGSTEQSSEVQHFATLLALCNTVEVTPMPSVENASPTTTAVFGDEAVSYQAASPDEVALCCGAAKLGVVLHSRTLREAVVRIGHNTASPNVVTPIDETWLVHHVFLFSSERKAMGIIFEHKQRKRILLVVKGADDSVATMLKEAPGGKSPKQGTVKDTLSLTWQGTYPFMAENLQTYAKRGLRTLLVAQRELTRNELNEFFAAHRLAELALENRQEKKDALRTAMEVDLELIGITAIEDKLQENVQDTIGDVLNAGMMLWMLTGDKVETAEQIGLSCGLYGPQDRVIRVVEGDPAETDDKWEEVLLHTELPAVRERSTLSSGRREGRSRLHWGQLPQEEKQSRVAMGRRVIQRVRAFGLATNDATDEAISGTTRGTSSPPTQPLSTTPTASKRAVLIVQGGRVLEKILSSPHLAARFEELSRRCISVICARTTPSQKAMITRFVREQGKMTLSIGDGGNDVAMIQEAHVGVGIVGKEGQQAARAADFAILKFCDLRQLLFVHGQQAYVRTAYVIKYSFYKSMIIAFIQLVYNMTGTYFSGGTFWNSFSLTMWNGLYTLPQTLFYCLDRFAPRVVLERCPPLYKMTRHAMDMDVKEFFGWYVLRGVIQSVVLLALVTGILGGSFAFRSHGYASSNDINFTVAYSALILSQMITVFVESHSVTWLNVLWLIGMPIFYVASTLAFSDIPKLHYYGVLRKTLSTEFWLAILGIAVVLTAPVIVLQGFREALRPNPRDILRSAELKRQRTLLRQRSYRSQQPFLVRFFGSTPEAPSPSLLSSDSMALSTDVGNRRSSALPATDTVVLASMEDNKGSGRRVV